MQRLKGSRAGFHAHVMRTFKKADDIMNTGDLPTPTQIAKLTSIMEQLTQKKDTLNQLNAQVLETIKSSEELETEILEADGIQNSIIEYIAMIRSHTGIHNIINISNYSTLERLLRVSTYVLIYRQYQIRSCAEYTIPRCP